MRKTVLTSLFGLASVLSLSAQTAKVQAIHNSPHPTADSVDVWVTSSLGTTKLLTNFKFRQATPFVDVPAGIPVTVAIALPGSSSINDTVAGLSITASLNSGERYLLLAQGNVSTTGYAANPNSINTAFAFLPVGGIRNGSSTSGNTDLIVVHGSPDAPGVDVYAAGIPTALISDLRYNQASSYLSVPADEYVLQIHGAGSNVPLLAKVADLSGAANASLVVFASGYFNPANNNNGPGFGLFVATPNGDVEELENATAQLQAIHNSPHPTADSVDVWVTSTLGTTKLLPNFKFRQATPFVDVPAGIPVTVAIALPGSASIADTVAGLSITANLTYDERYLLLAQGNVSTTGYAANPDGIKTSFAFLPVGGIRESASSSGNADLIVIHGSPDAPGVDIYAKGVSAPLISDLRYNSASSYVSVPAARYVLKIHGAGSPVAVAAKVADLSAAAGASIVVFASGYFNPAANNNGPGFGIFAALPDGTVEELDNATASVQVIHNAADPAAASVDVYYNGARLLDDFGFRKATGFVSVAAETPISFGVAPGNSTSAADTLKNFNYTLEEDKDYIVVANGVLNPMSFKANPDGRATAFNLFVNPSARRAANNSNLVDVTAFHGATDIMGVDVVVAGNPLVNNLFYGDFSTYASVPPAAYVLNLTKADSNNVVLAAVNADLSTLTGRSATLLASGFLDNAGGLPAFRVIAALADGTVLELPFVTASTRRFETRSLSLYPNPAADRLSVVNPFSTAIAYTIRDLNGRVVMQGNMNAGENALSTDRLGNGFYSIEMESETTRAIGRFVVTR
jgi:hypothetical protein